MKTNFCNPLIFCVVMAACVFLSAQTCFSGSKLKLKKGMSLHQVRNAVVAAGWIIPVYNTGCFTPDGKRRVGDDDIYSCAGRSDDFLREFTEYNGVAGSSGTIYGMYRNKQGKCLVLGYTSSEAAFAEQNTSKILKSMRLELWDPIMNQCGPY